MPTIIIDPDPHTTMGLSETRSVALNGLVTICPVGIQFDVDDEQWLFLQGTHLRARVVEQPTLLLARATPEEKRPTAEQRPTEDKDAPSRGRSR